MPNRKDEAELQRAFEERWIIWQAAHAAFHKKMAKLNAELPRLVEVLNLMPTENWFPYLSETLERYRGYEVSDPARWAELVKVYERSLAHGPYEHFGPERLAVEADWAAASAAAKQEYDAAIEAADAEFMEVKNRLRKKRGLPPLSLTKQKLLEQADYYRYR